MPRVETSTEDAKIEQHAPLTEDQLSFADRPKEIVQADSFDKEQTENLAFFNEPVTIVIQPSGQERADIPQAWNNGKCAEIQSPDGNWVECLNGYLPVGQQITVKRKILETLLRARVTKVSTAHNRVDYEGSPINDTNRNTTLAWNINIMGQYGDRHNRWYIETMRRNF